MRRIVLTGSECTGKTTLASRLAAHFGTTWSEEYARTYAAAKGTELTFGDVVRIGRGQVEVEEKSLRAARTIAFHDTDLLSTIVYSHHYYGDCPAEVEAAFAPRRADLYLLCAIDVPWTADLLQRDRGERREEMQELFHQALLSRRLPFVEIRGTPEVRLEAALRAIAARPRGSAGVMSR